MYRRIIIHQISKSLFWYDQYRCYSEPLLQLIQRVLAFIWIKCPFGPTYSWVKLFPQNPLQISCSSPAKPKKLLMLNTIFCLSQFNTASTFSESTAIPLPETVSKELDFLKPKFTLWKLDMKLTLSQQLQSNQEMLLVLLFRSGIDENVFDEYYDELVQVRSKNPIHRIYEQCWRVR